MLGVWHFSFTVANLERSIAFYTKLGLELLLTQEQANEYTRAVFIPVYRGDSRRGGHS